MLGRDDILGLVPQQDGMCLLNHVVEWDETSVLVSATTHRDPANPLRVDGRLRAIHLCEYGAQAMAVHGGLLARARAQRSMAGMLVSLRDVNLYVDYIDDLSGTLMVKARCLHADDTSSQYEFRASHDGIALADGRIAVISLRNGSNDA